MLDERRRQDRSNAFLRFLKLRFAPFLRGQVAGESRKVHRLARLRIVNPEEIVENGDARSGLRMLIAELANPAAFSHDRGQHPVADKIALFRDKVIEHADGQKNFELELKKAKG